MENITNEDMVEVEKAKVLKKAKGFGIASIVFAFISPIIGMILSYISKRKFEEGGDFMNNLPKWGWRLSWLMIVLSIVLNVMLRQ